MEIEVTVREWALKHTWAGQKRIWFDLIGSGAWLGGGGLGSNKNGKTSAIKKLLTRVC